MSKVNYRLSFLILLLVLSASCEKLDLLPPDNEDVFHPDSGVELVTFTDAYLQSTIPQRIVLEWENNLDLFPDPSQVTSTTVIRNGVIRGGVNVNQTFFYDQNISSGQTYTYQLRYNMDGGVTSKLNSPVSITVP